LSALASIHTVESRDKFIQTDLMYVFESFFAKPMI